MKATNIPDGHHPILQSDILDLLFDQRFKDYGAYELRKNYAKRAKRSVLVMIIFSSLVSSVPLLAGLITTKTIAHIPPATTPRIIRNIPAYVKPSKPVQTHIEHSAPKSTIPVAIVKAPIVSNDPLPPQQVSNNPTGSITNNDHNNDDITPSDGNNHIPPTTNTNIIIPEPDPIVSDIEVQQLPEFPGGEDALSAFLSQHIHYPQKAIDNDAEGRVVLGFVVDKNGNIDELKILKSVGFGCDEEAIRVVQSMPKWKPGKNNGKAVRVYFNLPISFEINR